ncbi:MAG: hypothetical protein JST22_01865 [Bacteroidetes bacterium]|nr:hypothetical protein [Bacteroidota bacterium]
MMLKYFLPFLLASVLLAACGHDEPAGPRPIVIPRADEAIVYSRHIEPIFKTSCGGSGCHLDGQAGGAMRMDSWDAVMAGTDDGVTEVVPYSARKSHLFQHIVSDTSLAATALPRMPTGRDSLPMDEVLAIKRWIDEGAKSDRGDVALAGVDRRRIFIASRTENLIAAIDQQSLRVARYLPASADDGNAAPAEPLASSDGALYVTLPATGTVARYDARTLTRTAQVQVGAAPAQIAASSNGGTLYIAHSDPDAETQYVSVVDARSMRMTGTIDSVGRAPHGLVLSPDGRQLYTINTFGDDISVVDLATGKVLKRIPVSYNNPLVPGFIARYQPYCGLLAPDGHTLWVTCRRSGEARAVDLDLGAVVDSIFVGVQPMMPAITKDGRYLWVPNVVTNSISVIDLGTRRLQATIPNVTQGPNAVAFSPDGKTAYVTCESLDEGARHGGSGGVGGMYEIDVANRVTLAKIEIAAGSTGIAVTP